MNMLYAYMIGDMIIQEGEDVPVASKRKNNDWMVLMHMGTFTVMKGKIDNVAFITASDNSHVAIFPIERLNTSTLHGDYTCVGQDIESRRIRLLLDGQFSSLCEQCSHYVECASKNFESMCKTSVNNKTFKKIGAAVLDFSPLTFVTTTYARLNAWGNVPYVDYIDLSVNKIDQINAEYKKRGEQAARTKKYRKKYCSNCLLSCTRSPIDKLTHKHLCGIVVTEDILKQIYDVYTKVIFGNRSMLKELRYCLCQRGIFDEFHIATNAMKQAPPIQRPIIIRPFYKNHFILQSVGDYPDMLLSAKVMREIFRGRTHSFTDEFIKLHRDNIIFAYSILRKTSSINTTNSCRSIRVPNATELLQLSLSHLIKDSLCIDTVKAGTPCIPGTDIHITDNLNFQSTSDILMQAETLAKGIRRNRKNHRFYRIKILQPEGKNYEAIRSICRRRL